MSYYIDQIAEQDRRKRLADLLLAQQTPMEDFTVTTPPPANMPANFLRNESTGALYDLGQSMPQNGPDVDFTAPVKLPGYGKGYWLKGDRTRAVLADGRIVDLGRDTGAERQREKENLTIAKGEAELQQTNLENQAKQRILDEDAEVQRTGTMTAKQYERQHGRIPAGFELYKTPGGQMDVRPVQGGKQYIELSDRINKFDSAIKGFGEYEEQLSKLQDLPGREAATGFSSITNRFAFPGGDAQTFLNELKTFTSQAFLSNIDKLRGTGPLSNMEGEKLQAAIGNLDVSSDEDTFVKNLTAIKQRFANLREIAGKEAGQARGDLKRADYAPITGADNPPQAPKPTVPPASAGAAGSSEHKANWIARAKQLNPSMSGAELEAKYLQKFKGR